MIKKIGNGGLSGGAIATKSTQIVAWLNEFLKESKPIVGVGGIDSLQAAIDKLNAGADLIQIYTGMVYKGPGLVKEIKKGLQKKNYLGKINSISQTTFLSHASLPISKRFY